MHKHNDLKRHSLAIIMAIAISLMTVSFFDGLSLEAYAASKLKKPTSLKVVKNDQKRTLKVSWKKPSKKTKVQVYLKKGKSKYKKVGTTSKKSITIKNLKYGVKYKVKIRAKNGKKYSKFRTCKKTIILKSPAVRSSKAVRKAPATNAPQGNGTNTSGNTSVIRESSTRIIDQGWIQFVAVAFEEGYNKENCRIVCDGTDITDAVTDVTDDGSIVKWEITDLKPASLTVSTSDGKSSETVRLSNNGSPAAPVLKGKTHADYVMGHAPVTIYDYYLTNYDDQGNVRTMPAKTTFATKASEDRIRSYAEDAELKSDGSGEVVVMFNYKSESDKAWFDGVAEEGALELVQFDEQKNTINSRLTYTKDTRYPHGSGTVAAVKIPLGQDNFRTNGRYYIRTKSSAGRSALTSINVVNETAPTMLLSENGAIRSGQNIHFRIENMVEGLKESIEEVTLTTPSGKTSQLAHIDDWYHFGNTGLFVVYNDVERNDGKGVNHTVENGVYTITIKAAGFKTFSKKFEVTGGSSGESGAEGNSLSSIKVDAMSGASAVVDSSGSGGSGGSKVSANLLFDVDLLANAIIMDELGMDNAHAKAIAQRWQTEVIADYVFSEDGVKFFTWNEYVNAVNDAKLDEGKYLTFRDYAQRTDARTTDVRPSQVKSVLEDNMLGDITDKYIGVQAPELVLVGDSVEEGSDAVFTCTDSAYIEAIKSITPSDDTRALDPSRYATEDGKLIIRSSALKLGQGLENDNIFDIKATGYKEISVVVPYKKTLEDIELAVEGDSHSVGEDVTVLVNGSTGDFLANLETVKVGEKQVYNASAGGTTGNRYYELGSDKTSITFKDGLFPAEGSYVLTIKARYYGEKTIEVTMNKKQDAEDAKDAPGLSGVEKSGNKLTVKFNVSDSDAAAYLADVRSVKVGDVQYEKALLGLSYNPVSQYAIANDPYYGGPYSMLLLAWKNGFSDEADTEVEVTTNSYKPLKFTVTKDGTLATGDDTGGSGGDDTGGTGGDDPAEEGLDAPAATSLETVSSSSWYSSYKYHYLCLSGTQAELTEYISKITSVNVGGHEYTKLSDSEYLSDASGNKWKMHTGNYGHDRHIGMTAGDGFNEEGSTVITIKADGYKTLTVEAAPDGKLL